MGNSICIITSVRNCMVETAEYLESLKRFPPKNLSEIIIVDDGSEEETQKFLSSKKGELRVFRNLKSKGFAFSNNLGAAKAKAEWLLFMNNDLVLSRGWSDSFHSLTQDGESHDELGCVGNIQLDPVTRKIDHAGVVFSNGIPEHFWKGKKEAPTNYSSEHLAVTGACFLIKRELFLSVGGFDETYKTGFEDIDLCLRLSMLGYKHYVLNKSVILHKKSSTPERNQFQSHNSRIFYSRWGRVITRFQEWESAKRDLDLANQSSLKGYDYVLKKKEDFLFSDTKILNEYFSTFLKKRNFKFAKHILSILQIKFSHEENTQLKSAQFYCACEEFEQAVAILSDLLEVNPRQIDACLLLGRIFIQIGEVQKAFKILGEAKKYHPDNAHIFSAISKCMLLTGKVKEAEGNARISTILDSELMAGWQSLLKVFQEKGQVKEEIKILRLLLDRYPKDIKIINGLIAALSSLNLHGKIWGLSRKFEKRISTGESAFLCAQACYEIGDFNQCSIFLDKVLASDPENEKALMLSGNLAVANKDFPKAIRDYNHVLKLIPDSLEASSNLANSKSFICDWSNREIEIKKLQTWCKEALGKLGLFEVSGLYFGEANESKNAFAKAKAFNIRMKLLREKLGFSYRSSEEVRKRIGFLSSDFRNHAVGHQFIGLLDNLDLTQYDIFLFATSPSENTEIRNRYEQLGENFHDINGLSLAGRASSINQADLDLLIDLGGFSRGHNAELLAMRPSPRQAHFLGYASSMGEGLVDYTIADSVVIPRSSSKFYGEKVIRMDGCFFPPGDFEGFAPRVKRKEVGLPPRGFVFCAFHAAYKLDPEIWSSWMRILKAVPESVLWLKFKPANDAFKNLKKEAVRLGVSSKRIILAEDLSDRKDHLSRMTVADLYLDCPLYNGHASAMDALHAKLPILTLEGKRFCSRVGETFMKNLGLPEMVAKNLDEYEKQAIELGRRPSRLLPLRKKISENADAVLSPVLHAERFQSAIEQILSKKPKISKALKTAKAKASLEITDALSLEDFTLVMVRPIGITNWAYNVNMLAHELRKNGGQTIIIEASHPEHKRSDFSSFVKRIPQLGQSCADILNLGLSKVSTKYLFYLDDPLRALPAKHFAECLYKVMDTLQETKVGFLGIGSKVEPNTGVLVTTDKDSSSSKFAGLFAPTFALNLDALTYTGGFRSYLKSLALSCLDLSLRMEQQGYRSALVELDKLICPVHTGNDYLKSAGESMLTHFNQLWNVKPVSLKPKYPPKDEQVGETPDYQEWIRLCDTVTEADMCAFKQEVGRLQNIPLISVILPVFDPPKKFLVKAIESVLTQAYENWELCIADDASTKKFVRPLLESYARKDSRIKVTFRKTNGNISVASNSALKLANGEFVAFLDHDDELRLHSLLEVAKVINANPDAKLIYSDEDKLDEQGGRYEPYFKPDWNPDLLLGQNYISHLSTFKTSLVKQLKGLRKGFEGAQDWDLTLRITEKLSRKSIVHIPKILYHWRAIKSSTASGVRQKRNIFEVTEKTIVECFQRRKLNATLCFPDSSFNYPRTEFEIDKKKNPKVSIFIPTKDRIDLLETCVTSIFATIEHNNFEVIIIDNDSTEKRSHIYLDKIKRKKGVEVFSIAGEFNYSKLNNLAIEKARGEVLLLLNNDIEASTQGWFEEMLSHAMRPEIGCVGAKLHYPDGRLQHGGVIIGLLGGAGHSHKFVAKLSLGFMGHLSIVRNTSAVTAACMMVRKEVYQQAGGLDEKSFKVAFNDVDFCLRVEKLGYRNLWTPFAQLVHHESATRGDDQATQEKRQRSSREILNLQNKWTLGSYYDPHYNRNLTKLSEQYWFGLTRIKRPSIFSKRLESAKRKIYDSGEAYRKLFKDLSVQKGQYNSTFITAGGKSEKMGQISLDFLRKFGLRENDFLVDVGCGYGRLTAALTADHKGQYLGTDVVPELLNYARANFGREGWDFKLVDASVIPAEDNSVDMVCFFSVFTHLLHEQSFTYLEEVKRVLKDDGKVVFSFIDFKYPDHVPFFKGSVSELEVGHPLNVFMNEDLIQVWAKLLGFECVEIFGAEEKKSLGYPFSDFGQSIACLKKVNLFLSENKDTLKTKVEKNPKLSLTVLQTGTAISKRRQKKDLILPVLKEVFDSSWNGAVFNCMPKDAEQVHGIVETENISEHEYDGHAIEIIESIGDSGMILDCGSGKRPSYYSNVVNFDPVLYETTDVVGVGEQLPFKDSSFDAVFSLNVLEHVRDPFRCASEIARVLKPEGRLYCVVPFMSPYHGYPDHYYNMTKSGLHNLFKDFFEIEEQDVLDSGHPIHSITWALRSWAEGLGEKTQKEFLEKKVGSLLGDPNSYFNESFVNDLSLEKKFELGATTALWGKKKQFSLEFENSDLKNEGKQNFERNDYKECWNRLSSDFDSARHHVTGDVDEDALEKSSMETIFRIDSYVKFNKNDIVLEIGCGIGRVGKELAPMCKKWIGCDISGNMLIHAKRRLSFLKNIELIELSESNLSSIPDNSIDVVYCTVVFMHLDEWDRYEYIKEAFRVLRSGGRAYFDNFSLTTEEGWRIFEAHYFMADRPSHISKSSTPEELSQYMHRSKFVEVKTQLDEPWVIVSGFKSKEECINSKSLNLAREQMLEVFSLHIPKTGGTSFGKSLQLMYGKNYLAYYPEFNNQGLEHFDLFLEKKCIHGHLMLDHYRQLLEQTALITWLRCPVDRTISLYHHIWEHFDDQNEFHQKVLKEKLSLIDFSEMPENDNQLFRWIGDRNPEDFKFIGFLENVEKSIAKCSAVLGWSHVPNFPWTNRTRKIKKRKISSKEREFIKMKNSEEHVWIEKAKELFG